MKLNEEVKSQNEKSSSPFTNPLSYLFGIGQDKANATMDQTS